MYPWNPQKIINKYYCCVSKFSTQPSAIRSSLDWQAGCYCDGINWIVKTVFVLNKYNFAHCEQDKNCSKHSHRQTVRKMLNFDNKIIYIYDIKKCVENFGLGTKVNKILDWTFWSLNLHLITENKVSPFNISSWHLKLNFTSFLLLMLTTMFRRFSKEKFWTYLNQVCEVWQKKLQRNWKRLKF